MAITLAGVLGSPTELQPIAFACGEGVTVNVPTTTGGVAEDFSAYAVKTCRLCARRRDGAVIVDRLGSFVAGVPQFVINSSDTKDIAPQIASYDVWVILDGVPSRIVARSVFQLLEAEVDLDDTPTTPSAAIVFAVTRVTARTPSAVALDVPIITLPPNSGGLLHLYIGATSNPAGPTFSTGVSFEMLAQVYRTGSGDGSLEQNLLLNSILASGFESCGVSLGVSYPEGVVSLTLQGRASRPMDWTIVVVPAISTYGQA